MDGKLMRFETEVKIVPSSLKQLNPEFALCDILVCYPGDNRNFSSISKEVIEDALYSLYGVPIIGEWIYTADESDGDWGSHGGRIIIDDKGIRFEQTTRPYGFVTKDAVENATWVTITEKNGHVKHEYLKLSGCILWTERYEEAKSLLDQNYGQSMEISIDKGHYREDHYYVAEKITFSALCILGTDVEPCFESASIGRHYNLDSFKQEYSRMLKEYNEFEASQGDDSQTVKGDTKMELSKFVEILSAITIEGSDSQKYALLSVDENRVFALDMEDYKPYSFEYAITSDADAENIVVDFDSKAEASLSGTDKVAEDGFVGFSILDTIKAEADNMTKAQTALLEQDFNAKVDELRQNYEDLSASYKVAMSKLESYEAKEAEEKAIAHKEEIDALFNKYAEKLGHCADFLVYKAKVVPAEVSTQEVEEKLTLMVGKYMMDSATKKNFNYQPNVTKANSESKNKTEERYGHLFDKFA